MKKIPKELSLIFPFLILLILGGCGSETKEKMIVAQVGDVILTQEDVEAQIPADFKNSITLAQKRIIVDRWIESEILLAEAKKGGIDKDDKVRTKLAQTTKDILIAGFVEKEFGQKIIITDDQAQTYYERNKEGFKRQTDEVRASQILVKSQGDADSVLKRLIRGEDFATLAYEMSTDLTSKSNGGDLGYFNAANALPAIAEAAFTTPLGEIAPVTRSEFGFHIIKVTDKKQKGSVREFELVKDQIKSFITTQREIELVRSFLQRKIQEVKIKRFGWAAKDTSQGP